MQEATTQQGEAFSLDQRVAIQDVAELKARLSELRDDKEHIVIGASAVESIDTAGLQLLAAFVRSCEDREQVFNWSGTSDVMREKAELLGLSDTLGLERHAVAADDSGEEKGNENNNETETENEDGDADGLLPVF